MNKPLYLHGYKYIKLYVALWSINIYIIANNTMQIVRNAIQYLQIVRSPIQHK